MGLFDFAQEIGHSLFTSEGNAADKIYAHIMSQNPGLEKLGVSYKGGVVTLIGLSNSAEAVQKAVLMAGNVKGVKEVVSNIYVTPNAKTPPAQGSGTESGNNPDALAAEIDTNAVDNSILEPKNVEYYTIAKGDNLSKIAQKYYGNASQYPRIFDANREVIKDPNLIFVGQKIRIPLD
jgi:nucleoid-associated protein YgaU